jgi:hypothetical protein
MLINALVCRRGLRGFEITDPDGYVLFFGCSGTASAA